ncbi:8012_t:CDS:2 [Entrophospora sp. SA101]|nr:8012_t:CDS:2 [Entrophospora sp. SA101]
MDEFVDSIYEEQREQGLIQEISSSIKDLNCDNSEISANNVRPNCDNSEITRDFETQDIICLYQNACVAEKDAIEANQSEISCWCLYAKRFKGMVKDFMINDEIGEKKVKGRVYDFIIKQVPGIKHGNLCKQTQKALKIYNLFEKIGINKIQHIKTYSADTISRFTNLQIQTIIDHFAKKPDIEYTDDQNDSDDLPKIEVNLSQEDGSTARNFASLKLPEAEKQKHVIKMALERFPVLSLKYSNESGDYFTCSEICPICNKDHIKENMGFNVEGIWDSEDYTKIYYLKCWKAYQKSIQIIMVKA